MLCKQSWVVPLGENKVLVASCNFSAGFLLCSSVFRRIHKCDGGQQQGMNSPLSFQPAEEGAFRPHLGTKLPTDNLREFEFLTFPEAYFPNGPPPPSVLESPSDLKTSLWRSSKKRTSEVLVAETPKMVYSCQGLGDQISK